MPRNEFDGKERRAYFRLDKALKVHLRLSGNNPTKTYTATTKNISHGGLCVEVPHHQKELIEKLCAAREDSELNLEATIRTDTLEIAAEYYDELRGGGSQVYEEKGSYDAFLTKD